MIYDEKVEGQIWNYRWDLVLDGSCLSLQTTLVMPELDFVAALLTYKNLSGSS
jgi:hypothetical protein